MRKRKTQQLLGSITAKKHLGSVFVQYGVERRLCHTVFVAHAALKATVGGKDSGGDLTSSGPGSRENCRRIHARKVA
jgi:hypothetical protein